MIPSSSLPNLADAARSLGEIERAHLTYIMITPGDHCYVARFVILLYMPTPLDPDLPEGVSLSGIQHAPDIERQITWRTPAWQQCLDLVNDAQLAQPAEFGTMEALEKTRWDGDHLVPDESGKHWVVSMHGPARSPERDEWLARMIASPFSARLG